MRKNSFLYFLKIFSLCDRRNFYCRQRKKDDQQDSDS